MIAHQEKTAEAGDEKVLHDILSSAKMLTLTGEEIELIARFRTSDSHAKSQAFDCVGGVEPVDTDSYRCIWRGRPASDWQRHSAAGFLHGAQQDEGRNRWLVQERP